MSAAQSTTSINHLDRPIDINRDHYLGNPKAAMTLVEYGSYACPSCREAHNVIINLRNRFENQLRYVFRHNPITKNELAEQAATLAEYAGKSKGKFWEVHDALMKRGSALNREALDNIAEEFELPSIEQIDFLTLTAIQKNIQADKTSARKSGATLSPTFFIKNRIYEGPWDESSLSEELLDSLGHRVHTATIDFVRWGPSAGIMLLAMSFLAIILVNSPIGSSFLSLWSIPLGIKINQFDYSLTLLEWINDGLLSLFFLVVALEIKREFTIGRLATLQAASLPIFASLGGVIVPALFYIAIIPAGPFSVGWGTTISTDTAFAIAIIVMLGDRVPVELRIFLTATAIVDDIISIIVVAIFYSNGFNLVFIGLALFVLIALFAFNHFNYYSPVPYVVLGITLWFFLHQAGLHPTLAGVLVALLIPTIPPPNLHALTAQAESLFSNEALEGDERLMRDTPSVQTLRILDNIHDRIESPASKLLRTVEPWSSYFVLPLFALANSGILFSFHFQKGDIQLMIAIFIGLVIGKPLGILLGVWLSTTLKLAEKPLSYTWGQLTAAAILAGMGFTMSLFIAANSFPLANDFNAAKIAIFIASLTASFLATYLFSRKKPTG